MVQLSESSIDNLDLSRSVLQQLRQYMAQQNRAHQLQYLLDDDAIPTLTEDTVTHTERYGDRCLVTFADGRVLRFQLPLRSDQPVQFYLGQWRHVSTK